MKQTFVTIILLTLAFFTQAQWKDGGSKITTIQNVGIGTENPQYKLDVGGDMRTLNFILPSGFRITPYPTSNFNYQENTFGHYALGWNDDSWSTAGNTLWQSAFGGIKFFTSGVYRMGINGAGNVGIGTDKPQYKLDVVGDIRSQNIVLPQGCRITPYPTNNFNYQEKTFGYYSLGWNDDSWSTAGNTLWQSAYGGIKFFTSGTYRMGINGAGNIGIGTDKPQYKLDVLGTIRATEVKVEAAWADFVFDKDYKLRSLDDVKAHIQEYKHLPDIPSEKEVQEQGINIGEMQAKLLQKIEELTLYVIQQNERIIEQNKKNRQLESEILELKTKLEE